MNNLRKIARLVKNSLKGVEKEFDASTLPWIDKASDADVEQFMNHHDFSSFPYDMREKLHFWRKNGYVIFEKAIAEPQVDAFLRDFEDFQTNPQNFSTSVLVEMPSKSEKKGEFQAKEVPTDVLKAKGIKVNDFYNTSETGKKIMLHPVITGFLRAIFTDVPVGMQSLNFTYGSQQPAHMDFPYVVSGIPSHLAAAWIALEDVTIDSGPLFYYSGSHKMKKFNWGNGIIYHVRESYYTPLQFAAWLEKNCQKNGYKKEVLLIEKGDVLIWHAALVHGGTVISNPEKTRKSFVCHYSTKTALPAHRYAKEKAPIEYTFGEGVCYHHPILTEEENYYPDTLN